VKKTRLLLLDANVVIELHRLGLWNPVLERCEVILARTVIDESRYYAGEKEDVAIDWGPDLPRIRIVDLEVSEIQRFRDRFSPLYLEKLDAGETESLAYLTSTDEPCLICSSDAVVYRVLGALKRSAQGISLEEVLEQVGLTKMPHAQYTRAFRKQWSRKGFQDGLGGLVKRDREGEIHD
jgi:hypothetical protein